jgi:hypothetical protein
VTLSKRQLARLAEGTGFSVDGLLASIPDEPAERYCSECGCVLTEQESTRCSICYRNATEPHE